MKKKNILGFALAFALAGTAIAPLSANLVASANEVDLADRSFIEFVTDDTTYTGNLTYTHSPLYNENLEVSGREYLFSIGQVTGYALMAEIHSANNVYYEIEELFYGKTSPFDACEGLPVYVDHYLYLDYTQNAFYNLSNGEQLSAETVAAYAQEGFLYYSGANGEIQNYTQTVNYATKTVDTYHIPYSLPNYLSQPDPVDCANIAGCILIGYYDRFCENLIPNFQTYRTFGSGIVYKGMAQEIYDLGLELSDLMGGGYGTTFAEFQSGMAAYVSGKGYTYATENMFTNGSFNYNKYQQAVQAGKPVAVFMSGFSLLNGIVVNEDGVSDTITNGYVNAGHASVGFGYRTDTYFNESGTQIAVRRYLRVASGIVTYGIGYLSIDGTGHIDKAISVNIS